MRWSFLRLLRKPNDEEFDSSQLTLHVFSNLCRFPELASRFRYNHQYSRHNRRGAQGENNL